MKPRLSYTDCLHLNLNSFPVVSTIKGSILSDSRKQSGLSFPLRSRGPLPSLKRAALSCSTPMCLLVVFFSVLVDYVLRVIHYWRSLSENLEPSMNSTPVVKCPSSTDSGKDDHSLTSTSSTASNSDKEGNNGGRYSVRFHT